MAKRISELLYGIAPEGDQVKLASIEGADVLVKSFGTWEGDLGTSATVNIEQDGRAAWFITASSIIVDALERVKDELPLTARFMKRVGASGRGYWTIE